jgi:DNA-binding response OmpR family regulator
MSPTGQGLAAAGKQPWDAVILDLMLPNVDGLEICRRIRQMTRYLPVIIISARTSETDRITGLEMGADDYLAKPFSVQELIARSKRCFVARRRWGRRKPTGKFRPRSDHRSAGAQCCCTARWWISRRANSSCCTTLPAIPARFFASGAAGAGLGLSARRL